MKPTCEQCGQQLNPVEILPEPVCGECTLKHHHCLTTYRRRLPSGEIVFQTTPPSEQELADEDHRQSR